MICRMGPAGRVIASSKFLAPLLVLLVLWPVLIRAFDVNPRVFPAITPVARAGLEAVRDGIADRAISARASPASPSAR